MHIAWAVWAFTFGWLSVLGCDGLDCVWQVSEGLKGVVCNIEPLFSNDLLLMKDACAGAEQLTCKVAGNAS
jgi:hypothetical protein